MARKHRARRQAQRRPLTNKESLEKLRKWLLPDDSIFSRIQFHGNIKWTPTCLVWLALCWAWSEARNLTDAFSEAIGVCQKMLTCSLSTYQGFMGALVRWTGQLLPVLRDVLQQRMEQIASKFWRIDGWVPIGFDGSRSTAPRSRSNEATFCAKNYGKGKTATRRLAAQGEARGKRAGAQNRLRPGLHPSKWCVRDARYTSLGTIEARAGTNGAPKGSPAAIAGRKISR